MKKNNLLLIAEAGVNHNGNLKNALRLVDIAKKAGADYIKFQYFKAADLATKNAKAAEYQIKNLRKKISQFEILKKLELSKNDYKILISYAKKKKIKFLLSIFDHKSIEILKTFKLNEVKIPSGEVNNYPLLNYVGKNFKKVFLSTGMSTFLEIEKAIKILLYNGIKKKNLFLLHCITSYPAPLEDVNILNMLTIKKKFKLKVGFSDHTIGSISSICAVTLGAKVIEKHITINKNMSGPDHRASMNSFEFINFVKKLRAVKKILGSYNKKISFTEKKNKKLVRKSIVALAEIKKGEYFSEKNIACKRPEGGLSPMFWNKIIGLKSKKNYKIDEFITV